jgi:HSP20 family protein
MNALAKSNGTIFQPMQSLLNDFLSDSWFNSSLSNWSPAGNTLPAVNVSENNDDFVIEVAAPGMKRDNFKVELDNHILTVSSERESREESTSTQGAYTRREFSYQSFQRSFALPQEKVHGEKIAAKYEDGILRIVVPKRDEAKLKPARQIQVG